MTDPTTGIDRSAPAPAGDASGRILVELPPMYFPMPLRRHDQVELLEKRGLQWMAIHGFCDTEQSRARVAGTRAAHFFGHLCPDADAELLQMAVDWAYVMFVVDDVVCDEESAGADAVLDFSVRIVRTLEVPGAGVLDPRSPFTAPIVDLAERVHRSVDPVLVRRLADAHYAWFAGAARQAAVRGRGAPSLNDYIFTRMLDSAISPTLAWFQLAEPFVIPEDRIAAPAARALTEMSGMVAAIDDDLYSYGKDLYFALRRPASESGAFLGNLVHLFELGHGDRDLALRETVALRDRIVARFIEVRDQVLPAADGPLARYLSNLTCLVRGNYEFGLSAGRYTNPDGRGPDAVATTGTVAGTPSAVGPPVGVPSIAWWWDALALDADGKAERWTAA
jgi:hypothetical protein